MFKILKTVLIFIVCIFIMVISVFYGFSSFFAPPNMDQALIPDAASQFYDNKGKVIYTAQSVEKRLPVKFSKIPKYTRNAFVAIEDNRFYEHSGIDYRGTLRALVSTLSGHEVQGGSTITQQLAKNTFLTQERTLTRKIREAFLAREIEHKYTKDEILGFYLNRIYFGNGAYGIESASNFYFGKHVEELTLAESATLAAIPKSPNYYNPIDNAKASKKRQELVLDQMVKYNLISKAEADKAKRQKIVLDKGTATPNSDLRSYLHDTLVNAVIDKLGADALYKGGLKIYTTVDMEMQKDAENAVRKINNYSSYRDEKKLLQPQVALAAVEPSTGYIKALVGGRGQDKFNRATMATRQPGSSFKPFVYLTAMQNGMTPATVVDDTVETFANGWTPHNSDNATRGKVSLRTALVKSLNIPTAKIAAKVGPDKIVENAKKMGISTLVESGEYNDRNLSMSLGGLSHGVIPLEMASAYGVLANNGVYAKPVIITKITDRDNKIIFEAKEKPKKVMDAGPCYLVTNMLQGVLVNGTAAGGGIGRPAAGKTGTTDEYKDAWFVGYTPNLSCAVWVGDDNNESINMYGSDAPLDIWQNFMMNALSGTPATNFTNPGVSVPAEPFVQQTKKKDDKNAKKKATNGKNGQSKASTGKQGLRERIRDYTGTSKKQ